MEQATETGRRVLRINEVMRLVGLKKTMVYRLIAAGDFPKSIRLGVRAVGWLECDVVSWLESRIKRSRTETGNMGQRSPHTPRNMDAVLYQSAD